MLGALEVPTVAAALVCDLYELEAACPAALGALEVPELAADWLEVDEGPDLEPEEEDEELEGDLEVPAGELGPCPAPEGPLEAPCPPWPNPPLPEEVFEVVVPVDTPRSTPLDEALSSA